MYNWSVFKSKGQIYSSSNNSFYWNRISCFNYSATGTFADENATAAGNVSQFGMNLTQIDDLYEINYSDYDSVNQTFRPNMGHNNFYVGPLQFEADECLSTQIYNSEGKSTNDEFEEVLLYEPNTRSIVYSSLLRREIFQGFDQNYHDFEMIVLEDGHGTDEAVTPYYFWVELQ